MPRFARVHAPGTLVHVIARLVNREFRLAGPDERIAYLDRLATALARTDWKLHAYALMSNHIHLAMIAGQAPLERFAKSVHISFAHWLNRTRGTFGPLFAERPTTVHLPRERLAYLVAYIHNNPVRANVARAAGDTDWTSHRSWLGLEPAPAWLHVAEGLEATGFGSSPTGRRTFDEFVALRAADPRNPELSGTLLPEQRAAVRAELALPIELTAPVPYKGSACANDVLHPGPVIVPPRWPGDLRHLLRAVTDEGSVPLEALLSRSRRSEVTRARRVAAVAGVFLLRRRVGEVAAALGVSDAAISNHLRYAEFVIADAHRVADALRAEHRSLA